MALRIGLLIVAAALLGAHFYRAGSIPLAGLCLASPLLFLWRRRWSLVLLQLFSYAAAALWVDAAIRLVALRVEAGRPWIAAAVILGVVALFTLAAGLLLNSRSLSRHYPS